MAALNPRAHTWCGLGDALDLFVGLLLLLAQQHHLLVQVLVGLLQLPHLLDEQRQNALQHAALLALTRQS
jgi:hypothetical protein